MTRGPRIPSMPCTAAVAVVLLGAFLLTVAWAPAAGAATGGAHRPQQELCDTADAIIPEIPGPSLGDGCRLAAGVPGFTADVGESILDFLEGATCFQNSLPFPVKAIAYSAVVLPAGMLAFIDLPWCDTGTRDPRPPCAARDQAYEEAENERPNLGGLLPDRCWGTYPSEYYDFNYDEGGMLSVDRKLVGTLTGLAFSAGKGLTQIGLWVVEWGYVWDADSRLGFLATDLSQRFDTGLVGPLQLDFVAWFVVVAWAGFTMLKGKLTVAAGEVALSVLLAVVAAVFTANQGGYRAGAFDTLNQLSDAVLAVGDSGELPQSRAETTEVLDDHLGNLHVAFVEEPYDHLNWGHTLGGYATGGGRTTEAGPCADERNEIVSRGPHGAEGYPRKVMEEGDCTAEANFNADMPWDKFFAGLLYFVAALVMFLLLGMVSLTVILAKLGVIFLFALAPFAAVLAVLPGGGRRTAWRWLSSLASMLALVVAMSFLLAFLVVAVDGLLTGTDVDMIERFLLLDAMVFGAVIARKRLLAGGQALAARLGDRLTATTPAVAGTASWGGGGSGGGGTSFSELAGGTFVGTSAARSADRQFERRRRRVDSTRGNRRHGLWMMANGLTQRPAGWRPPSMAARVRNRIAQTAEASLLVRGAERVIGRRTSGRVRRVLSPSKWYSNPSARS